MFAAEKKVISFKSGGSYSPMRKFPHFTLRGNGLRREMLVAVVKNFISAITFPIIIRWQMDSLCVSRGRTTFPLAARKGKVRLRPNFKKSREESEGGGGERGT